jgi:hypothetical protein
MASDAMAAVRIESTEISKRVGAELTHYRETERARLSARAAEQELAEEDELENLQTSRARLAATHLRLR